MCYFITLEIIPQNNAQKAQAKLVLSQDKKLRLTGNFPVYEITDGFCACRFIKNKGTSVIVLPEILQNLLSQAVVKRVNIIWYWGDRLPLPASIHQLSIQEFIAQNQQNQLTEGIWVPSQ